MEKGGASASPAAMARKPKPEAPAEQATQARALIDLPALGVKAGRLVTADAETIAALLAAGEVDTHPDAIAYAQSDQE